ncbi:MAG: helix-turn-helix domain-containing protein [Promethearchaeota archaeon]
MEISYFLPYDLEKSIGNAIIEIKHYKISEILKEIKSHPSVFELTIIEIEKKSVKFNVKTKDPYLLYAIIKCGILVDFPIRVTDGFAYWRLISTRKRIDDFLTILEKKNIKFELLRIGNSPYSLESDKNKLTIEELDILNKAIKIGFFEIPRKISLEDFAKQLGKSKSALSVMLRKIIKKKVMYQD